MKTGVFHRILNKSSNFVLISYWRGGDNITKNTLKTCDSKEKNLKNTLTYNQLANRVVEFCEKLNINYYLEEHKELDIKGGYKLGINYKPVFIKDTIFKLEKKYKRKYSVCYIDVDLYILKYPSLFDEQDIDFMAHSWNSYLDYHSETEIGYISRNNPDYCLNMWTIELSGGILFFANSTQSLMLLDMWKSALENYPDKADDRILSYVFAKENASLWARFIPLPQEYLLMNFNKEKDDKTILVNTVFYQDMCSTSEELDTMYRNIGDDSININEYVDYVIYPYEKCLDYDKVFYDLILSNNDVFKTFKTSTHLLKKHDLEYSMPESKKGIGYIIKTSLQTQKQKNYNGIDIKNAIKTFKGYKSWYVLLGDENKVDKNKIILSNIEDFYKSVLNMCLLKYASGSDDVSIVFSMSKNTINIKNYEIKFGDIGAHFEKVDGISKIIDMNKPITIRNSNEQVLFLISKLITTKINLGEVMSRNPLITFRLSIINQNIF